MQKLLTIHLDSLAYRKKTKGFPGKIEHNHGLVEEYLEEYLRDGWVIKNVSGFGGHSDGLIVSGWIVVLLEK